MSKVLYIGVFCDGTGWSQAAIDYALAMDKAGIDLVCRAFTYNHRGAAVPPPERILELMGRSSAGCDTVIQHVLPHSMDFNGRLRNIGLYASETSDFNRTSWADRLNNMDEVWVINHQMVDAARKSGVTVPITVVPHTTDIERFQRSYEPLDGLRPFIQNGDFLFYFIGEYVKRKNMTDVVKAFHLEFDVNEPVQLVLKTHKAGMPAEECLRHVMADCEKLRAGLKLNVYKPELVITERFSSVDMLRLHASCDTFVAGSYGEAWCIPAFDGMAMGKTPICPASTGFLDYLNDDCGWLVKTHAEPVFGVMDTFEDLFTGEETWQAIDVLHLRHCMRAAFENRELREKKAAAGIERAYSFSYQAIGNQIKEVLDAKEGETSHT
jgi:glycosyltransferase involved in cell wall biosynthesis